MTDTGGLLAAYDAMRGDAEVLDADTITRLGPLVLATYGAERGFITYRDLGGADRGALDALISAALDRLRVAGATEIEWKTRGHDDAEGLHQALLAAGFTAGDPESVMLGEARLLALDLPLPEGVVLRRITAEPEVRAMCAMQDEAFGDPISSRMADEILARLARDDGMELWVAEAQGRFVSAGRLEPVPGTAVAGLWGGATLPGWRGRGIYRALTAARARAAIARGKSLLHSDSTPSSRPILERSGLVRVTATTPYEWRA